MIPPQASRHRLGWVFPILHDHPDALRTHLNAIGFDATCGGSSLFVTPPVDGGSPRAVGAEHAVARLLYLPIYPGVTKGEIARLAAGIASFDRAVSGGRRMAE